MCTTARRNALRNSRSSIIQVQVSANKQNNNNDNNILYCRVVPYYNDTQCFLGIIITIFFTEYALSRFIFSEPHTIRYLPTYIM